jgi:hypothetical protein
MNTPSLLIPLALLLAVPVFAQDPVKVDPRHYKVEFEDSQIRVLRIRFGPREKSVMHEHPHGCVVRLTDEHTRHTMPSGASNESRGNAGTVECDPPTAEPSKHLPENLLNKPMELLLIERKAGPDQLSPEQAKLAVFLGDWTYEGEAKAGPDGPGGRITGTDRNRMIGNSFIDRRYEEKGPMGANSGAHIFGYDAGKKAYVTSGFSSAGVYDSGTVSIAGNTWTFLSTSVNAGRTMHSRCPVTLAADNNSFTVRCDVSTDGMNWSPSFEGKWTRVR